MATEDDHGLLLGEDSDVGVNTVATPRRLPGVAVVTLGLIAIASTTWLGRTSTPVADQFRVESVISAAESFPLQVASTVCTTVFAETHWPHSFEDVNWEGHCSDEAHDDQCKAHIIEKFVGDYFDLFIESITEQKHGATADDLKLVPASSIELTRWKERVIRRMQDAEKGIDESNNNIRFTQVKPPKWDPSLLADDGPICQEIYAERPSVTTKQIDALGLDCRPNYATYRSLYEKVNTHVPLEERVGESRLCNSWDEATGARTDCEPVRNVLAAAARYPAQHGWDTNASLAKCRHLFNHRAFGEDWISASLTVLDVRRCLVTGSDRLPTLSRSWVSSCIPDVEVLDDDGNVLPDKSSQTYGWPGWVYEFLGDYGAVGSDCVPDFEGLMHFKKESCPSLCENGESLVGHLSRPEHTAGRYRVIFNAVATNTYAKLEAEQHRTAKHYIYTEGPIVGLVERTQLLAACASEDVVMYKGNAQCNLNVEIENLVDKLLHSVVVHGWGSDGDTTYYRILSTAFQDEDHEAKIAECAVKIFVLPATPNTRAVSSSSSSFSAALGGYRATAACARASDFCNNGGAGYTDTEDCDGDGVMDHYCYHVGDAMTPTYEAFISSKSNCELKEQIPCSRSVLPGRKFGCQRPLGWCMNGEEYSRDVDCDGDGHFDHVCDTPGHHGFISSLKDCSDTWETGAAGEKCTPRAPLLTDEDDTITYKLVTDSGSCVQHANPLCVKSHPDWPDTKYPTGGCSFHVEWAAPRADLKGSASCDDEVVSNQSLFLDVLHMDVETAHFNTEGYLYGERLNVDGILVDPETATRSRFQVKDKSVIDWTTDLSVERRGWLACLRLRTKKPKIYQAKCTEIGDDIWAELDLIVEEDLVVQCDMTKCKKDRIDVHSATDRYRFWRTDNVCDAGWQVTKSSKFTISFSNPLRTIKGTSEETGTFVVHF